MEMATEWIILFNIHIHIHIHSAHLKVTACLACGGACSNLVKINLSIFDLLNIATLVNQSTFINDSARNAIINNNGNFIDFAKITINEP